MATHSNILSWRSPWTEEPSGLQSMGSQESDMTEHSQTLRSAGQEARPTLCNSSSGCHSQSAFFCFLFKFYPCPFSCLHEMIFFIKEHSGPHSLWQEINIHAAPLPLTLHGAHHLPWCWPVAATVLSGLSLSHSSQNKSHDYTLTAEPQSTGGIDRDNCLAVNFTVWEAFISQPVPFLSTWKLPQLM